MFYRLNLRACSGFQSHGLQLGASLAFDGLVISGKFEGLAGKGSPNARKARSIRRRDVAGGRKSATQSALPYATQSQRQMNSKAISRQRQRASSSPSASISTLTGPSRAQKRTREPVGRCLARVTPTATCVRKRSVAIFAIDVLAFVG